MTTETVQQYYSILGLTHRAKYPQIKAAYRKKAKLLHPDVNDSVDANAKFILLKEAYGYFTEQFSGSAILRDRKKENEPWFKNEKQRSAKSHQNKTKTEYRTRNPKENIRDSKFYWFIVAVHALMDHMILAGVLFVYTILLVFGTYYQGIPGLIGGSITVIVTLPHAITGFRNYRKERVK